MNKCTFCDQQLSDEEACRTHSLFAHGKLVPRCESKVYFNHLEKIEAARKQYHFLIKRIRQRERMNTELASHTRSLKNAFEYGYEIFEVDNAKKKVLLIPSSLLNVYKACNYKVQFRNHAKDVRDLVHVETILKSDGILVEVDGY